MEDPICSRLVSIIFFSFFLLFVHGQDFTLLLRQRLSSSEIQASPDPIVQVCRNLGIFRDPTNCLNYIICRNELSDDGWVTVVERYRCTFGIFDTRIQRCNWVKLSAPCDLFGQLSRPAGSPSEPKTEKRKAFMALSHKANTEDKLAKNSTSDRPTSYVSELSGLVCQSAGYFPHPRNNTKFYRCVALKPESFMIYLFSCEAGLLYEPTVRACVKSIGEERMETGVEFPLDETSLHTVHSWELERCRSAMVSNQNLEVKGALFRNPVNCRRFFRCSSTVTTLKIEHFSCPTGLFFDQQRNTCTWASETTDCLTMSADAVDGTATPSLSEFNDNTSQFGSLPSPIPTGTIATIWVTAPKVTSVATSAPSPTPLFNQSIATEPSSTSSITTSKLQVTDATESSRNFLIDSNWSWKQVHNPPAYLTATGVLIVDSTEFHCSSVGTFSSNNVCVFYKCEKYEWISTFLLFRFRCPPHTWFVNGTCEYTPNLICTEMPDEEKSFVADGSALKMNTVENLSQASPEFHLPEPETSTQSVWKQKQASRFHRPLLCLKDGIFPIPFASPCSARFMLCRRLSGPLHFFVSVHECPPSLIFSRRSNQCIDASLDNLDCPQDVPETSSFLDSTLSLNQNITVETPSGSVVECRTSGFIKTGCRKFRRCEWVDPDSSTSSSGVWVKYDFECSRGMVFDEKVSACVYSNAVICEDEKVTVLATTTQTSINYPSVTTPPILPSTEEVTTELPVTEVQGILDENMSTETPSTSASSLTMPLMWEQATSPSVIDSMDATAEELVATFAKEPVTPTVIASAVTTGIPVTDTSPPDGPPVCYRSGYFLYPGDHTCQRFYRCLQLTPEPSSFVMLHYKCDDGFVFDGRFFACSLIANAPPCELPNRGRPPISVSSNDNQISVNIQVTAGLSPDVKLLPQVWELAMNESDQTGALVCTTQSIYRLQTCGYYYSCIETQKGKFRLQEIYCETLYYNVSSETCVQPPPNDPCSPTNTSFSSIWSVRKPATKSMTPFLESTTTATTDNTTESITFQTAEATTNIPTEVTIIPVTTMMPNTVNNSGSVSETRHTQTDLSSAIFVSNPAGNSRYVIAPKNRVRLGTLIPGVRQSLQTILFPGTAATTSTETPSDAFAILNKTIVDQQTVDHQSDSVTNYRNQFNQLYAQLVKSQETTGIAVPTTQSALILNFNTISGQLNDIKTGMTFQCKSEGYFRNSRDITCSKFYLCVKVGPKQYNLFEFMCLPRNGIQWKYSQTRNQCVDPDDVNQC